MKKLMKRKNNKGFSLVELIVVVLIMGIIAVALAPQVMKWVQTSRENTDASQCATIKSAAQTAVADYMKSNSIVAADYKIDGTNGCTDGSDNTGLAALFNEVMGGSDYPTPKNGTGNFYIHVTSTGNVTVNTTAAGTPTPTP